MKKPRVFNSTTKEHYEMKIGDSQLHQGMVDISTFINLVLSFVAAYHAPVGSNGKRNGNTEVSKSVLQPEAYNELGSFKKKKKKPKPFKQSKPTFQSLQHSYYTEMSLSFKKKS
jgi:hypothetical protein